MQQVIRQHFIPAQAQKLLVDDGSVLPYRWESIEEAPDGQSTGLGVGPGRDRPNKRDDGRWD